MFERYTEKARRVIFFARYEASQWGASHIDTSHMLLALLREDKPLFEKLLGSTQPFENAADTLGLALSGEKVSTSVDLPLTPQLTRVLKYAADESKELHNPHITPGHLLLGLLREPSAASMLLEEKGLDIVDVRAALKEMSSVRLELRGLADPDPAPAPTNAQIIEQLRTQFQGLTTKLRPEMEPAVVYRLDMGKHK
jgi:ATP-dependent Clp protease ATP-binding subunit ClpC